MTTRRPTSSTRGATPAIITYPPRLNWRKTLVAVPPSSFEPMASTTVSKSIFVASYMLRSNFAPTKRTAETPTNKSSAWTAPLFWALPPSTNSSTLTPRAKFGIEFLKNNAARLREGDLVDAVRELRA